MMKKDGYADKEYWERYWEKEKRGGYGFYFEELLDQYITWDTVNSYMEIGGAPGSIMAFMNKKHELSVSTVDFTEEKRISELLKYYGIEDFTVYQADFLTFDATQFHKQYGIVASWGFVEHFEKEITEKFIEKQKLMVSDRGYLIVELPNIRKMFWLFYWLFNRKLLKIHNLKTMDLPWLKKCVGAGGEFELLYASYYFTMNPQNEYFVKHKKTGLVCEKVVDFFSRQNFCNHVKKWFFPYIVIIAKRK